MNVESELDAILIEVRADLLNLVNDALAVELERIVGQQGPLPYAVWRDQIAARAVTRLAELRGESR